MSIGAVILAGGLGSRLQSNVPKPLVKLEGKTLLERVLENLACLDLAQRVVVVGHNADEVSKDCRNNGVECAYQSRPIGTGDALRVGLLKMVPEMENLLVMNCDDSAFYRPLTLRSFIDLHQDMKSVATMMVVNKIDDTARTKVLREGHFFLEFTKCTGPVTKEFFTGCACFSKQWLGHVIDWLPSSYNGEFFITTLFKIARAEGRSVIVGNLGNPAEWLGINTPEQLAEARKLISAKELSH